jgi:hypothetical protein
METATVILTSMSVFLTSLTVSLIIKMWCFTERDAGPEADSFLVMGFPAD